MWLAKLFIPLGSVSHFITLQLLALTYFIKTLCKGFITELKVRQSMVQFSAGQVDVEQ